MKIFIEGHGYARKDVENVLPRSHMLFTDDVVTIENVGYFRNPKCNDFIFFLPKVVMNENGRVFCVPGDPKLANGFSPEEIIDPEVPTKDGRALTEEQKDFLYEFSVWIYRSLALYREKHPDTDAVWYQREDTSGGFRRQYITHTLLDVILALRRFHQDNRDYFLFKVQERHSGVNKINWTRTISKSTPIISDGIPIYLNPVNRRREIDFDEELLVIFYSILRYVSGKYGFHVKINMGYDLIPEAQFENYIEGYGCARLHQIKYKYFSDRDLTLWELCYAFFDKAHKAVVENAREEYLLAKKYEIVFESMIDDLIGDGELAAFKSLRDNKEIDHLYVDESVTHKEGSSVRSLFIADSKYYSIGHKLGDESVYKQFTYARNMLQLNLDLFLDGKEAGSVTQKKRKPFEDLGVGLLRDPVSEGYDVIPNFFISATLDESFDYDAPRLKQRKNSQDQHINRHFDNRLFDRDTLILSHYDVNFLYIVKLYAQNDEGLKQEWRVNVRKIFRDSVRKLLAEHFTFKALLPHDGMTQQDVDKFLQDNFHVTLGKVYDPYPSVNGMRVYSLAMEKPAEMILGKRKLTTQGFAQLKDDIAAQNVEVENLLRQSFYVVDAELGKDPIPDLLKERADHPVAAVGGDLAQNVQITSVSKGSLVTAVRKHNWCPCPMSWCSDPSKVRMLIIPFRSGAYKFKVDESKDYKQGLDANTLMTLWNNDSECADVVVPNEPYYAWYVTEV